MRGFVRPMRRMLQYRVHLRREITFVVNDHRIHGRVENILVSYCSHIHTLHLSFYFNDNVCTLHAHTAPGRTAAESCGQPRARAAAAGVPHTRLALA
jgi:hypothetical protein